MSTEMTLPADQKLISLDPEQYTAAVYKPFLARLESAKARHAELIADGKFTGNISTGAGMALATEGRAMWRRIRTESEAERKTRKAPILEIGRLLDAKAKEIAVVALPGEEAFDAIIKAEENRKEAARIEKERIERERIDHIQKYIADIRARADECRDQPSAFVAGVIVAVDKIAISSDFTQEFTDQAARTLEETKQRLTGILASAKAREERERHEAQEAKAERARIEAEREELERLRAEKEKQDQKIKALMAALAEANKPKQLEPTVEVEPAPVVDTAPDCAAPSVENVEVPTEVSAPQAEPAPESAEPPATAYAKPRPDDATIVWALMSLYDASAAEVIQWIADMNLADLRANFEA